MGGRGGLCRKLHSRLPDAIALVATSAILAAPTPVVSLDTILAPPPTASFVPDTESSGTPVGHFDAAEYAGFVSGGGDSALTATLGRDGFAGGFGASWTEQTTRRGLVELVVAFAGGQGARSWLGTAEAQARASNFYVGPVLVAGIRPYFGVHYADPSGPSFADVVSFVKGNNFFTVGFTSNADDLGDAAATQAKAQFDFAPADSIPPAQWPENKQLLAGGIGALKVAGVAALVIVGLGLLVSMGLFFYVRKTADAKLSLDGEGQPPDG